MRGTAVLSNLCEFYCFNFIVFVSCRFLQDHKVDDTGSEMNYGAGKSKFYAASDRDSHASVSKLLPTNPNKDRTLYLSRY